MSAGQMRRAWERDTSEEERRADMNRRKRLVGAAGAAIGATVLFAPAAQAANFTVNTLEDSDETEDDPCARRSRSQRGEGRRHRPVRLALSGTIHLENGDIGIYDGQAPGDNGGLDIQGPGPAVITVDANYNSRIFDVGGSTTPAHPGAIGGLQAARGRVLPRRRCDPQLVRPDGYFAASLTVDNTVIADSYAQRDGGGIS